MTNVAQLMNSTESDNARLFCIRYWGWVNPPEHLVKRAILTLRYERSGSRVGDIVADLKLMPASRVEMLAKQKQETGSPKPLLDYLIEHDDSTYLPEHKTDILAYKHKIQYLEHLDLDGLTIHDDMQLKDIKEAAKRYHAVLFLIDGVRPVLVFSGFNEEYQDFHSEGAAESLSNPLKQRYDDLIIAVGKQSQVLSILNQEGAEKAASNSGNIIFHTKLKDDPDLGKRKLSKIFDYARRVKASDIHINPSNLSDNVTVSVRVNGNLRVLSRDMTFSPDEYQVVKNFLTSQSGAVKDNRVLSAPADGRFSYRMISDIDVRCAFIPTGQDTGLVNNQLFIRLRLFPSTAGAIELDSLKIDPEVKKYFIRAIRPESGMVLMVGPTGSGKSTSLFGMVNEHTKIYGDTKSRLSIEDPVERKVPDIDQIQITDEIKALEGNPFLHYLETLVRFDPDFIVLGEVRDMETCEAAANYANTGHMVLGTLHANDSIKAIERIMNMIKDYDLRRMYIDSLHFIFSQRLIPLLCSHCKEIREIPSDLKADLESHIKRQGNNATDLPETGAFKSKHGCDMCDKTGIVEKKPVNEILEMTDRVKDIIFSSDTDKNVKLREHRAFTLFGETLKLVKSHQVSIAELFK